MDHGLPIETQVTGDLLTIAKKLNAPLLATNDSHYVHAEDARRTGRHALHQLRFPS